MKPIKYGAYLGKCGICTHKIHNTDIWSNKTAILINARYVCGACLVELVGASKIAEKEYNKLLETTKEAETITLPYLVDEATGKIKMRGKL